MFTNFIKRYHKPYMSAYLEDRRDLKDLEMFRASGFQVYVGRQGSGKTISAVKHLLDIKKRYPKCLVVTNLELNVDWDYIQFQTVDELIDKLVNTQNDKYGVVYLIDEIHTYFNALDSKGIPPYVFTEISQQRKQRKLIIGTSQLFTRIAKPFREQCDHMIACRTHFGVVTTQKAFDGMTLEVDFDGSIIGDVKKRGYFWHNSEIRRSYDTYQKVISASDQFNLFETPTRYDGKKRKYKI